jgi:RNA polymerase sigma-70 factor (ECF subfamily)
VFVARPVPLAFTAEAEKPSAAPVSLPEIGALTARMVKGEEDAFGQFYDSYSHRVFAYLFVLTNANEALAGELLQQTMIKVARYIRRFEAEEIFWSWLTRIARSCWVDEGRKQGRYLAFLEKLWLRRNIEENPPAASRMTDSIELLPPEDQELLRKKYLDGLSVKELAVTTGRTEKAIESRLSRIRQRIKDNLRKEK